MSPSRTLTLLALRGMPLALPAMLLPLLAGSRYTVREPLQADECATLTLDLPSVAAMLEIDAPRCPPEALEAWARIAVRIPLHVTVRDGAVIVAEARGGGMPLLAAEARQRLLGVSPVLPGTLRPGRADLLLAAMAGVVGAWLGRGRKPVRRRAGLPVAERVLGRRIPERTWYSLVSSLAEAGALEAAGYRGRVEPVRSVDLYYAALYLLGPERAWEIAGRILGLPLEARNG